MPWFNVDDGFAFHRKAVRAGNAAIGLWTRAGSWCAGELTDGFVPDHMIRAMRGTAIQTQRLVDAGLWVRDDVRGGFQFHEWSESGRNPTRKEVEKRREEAAKRKQKSRGNQHGKSENSQVGESGHSVTDAGVTGGVTGGRRAPTPLPSPPITTNPPSEGAPRKRSAGSRQGTRIPSDFAVTREMAEWAQQRRPDVDGRMETERFVNHWTAKTGKDATKLDWNATWRNWILGAKATPNYRTPGPTGGTGSKRVDKALGFLAANDPLRETFGLFGADPSELRVIEGGKTA